MTMSDGKLQIHFLLFFFLISSTQSRRDYKTFEVYNRYAKKCLSIDSFGLRFQNCTPKVKRFMLNWTENAELKGVYNGYNSSCIQAIKNTSLTTGECSSQDTVRWTCEGSKLRSQTGNWYLSWNTQRKEIEMTKTVNGLQGQWLIYQTDNNICYFLPKIFSTTTVPFTQPTASPRLMERNSAQLWPRGNYALPKAASGCPGGTNFTWKEGWVFQDLDDNGEIKTKSSSSFKMAADIDDYGNIKRWFCSKNVTRFTKDEDNKRPSWPKGTYCIYSSDYSSSKCPESEGKFVSGEVFWDNQYWINNSKSKGTLPRGDYRPGGRTGIYFCCQSSNRDANTPISLPTDQPFYLIAYRPSVCQKVQWATVIQEFVVYDTSDFRNHDYHPGLIPFHKIKGNPKIYYCYYQGCNHTLNFTDKEEGEINFPESPFMDIISQSCSWYIQFPSEFVISLDFLYFNIPSNQSANCSSQFIEIFNGDEQAGRSLGKWCGGKILNFTSLSNSSLIILKLEKNVTNTTGFRLNFKGISKRKVTSKEPGKEITTVAPKQTENSTPKPNSKGTEEANVETTSTSEENNRSVEPPLAKVSDGKFSTTSVVVPVSVIVVIGIILVAILIIRKRRKNDNNHIVTFQNSRSEGEENPVYEGADDDAKDSHVSIYESVDNDVTSLRPNITKTSILTLDQSGDDVNPLYESSGETEYSSTVNSLYVSNDC